MPNEAPVRFLDKFDPETVPFQSVYAMSSIVDESLRNVTGALQVQGMWPNTLMVVAADNVRVSAGVLWLAFLEPSVSNSPSSLRAGRIAHADTRFELSAPWR